MALRLKYTGGGYGGAINGVPARDLTDGDIQRLKLDADALVKGGLYVTAQPDPDLDSAAETLREKLEPLAGVMRKAERPSYSDKAVRGRRRIVEDKAADEGSG